jgi:hypothetical protein
MSQRANEEQFNELHQLVTSELSIRIKAGADCSTADIKAAIDWLSKNNITGLPAQGSPLAGLLESLEVDIDDVERTIK